MRKEITFEEYSELLNYWEKDKDGKNVKYIRRVPEGKRLVVTSTGKYYLDDTESVSIPKPKKKK